MEKESYTPINRYCYNCSQLLHGIRKSDNTARLRCPNCGVEIYSVLKSRRKEVVTFYAPISDVA